MATQYRERDQIELEKAGGYFSRHMSAMTEENLFDKSAIAEELAWRDMEIDRLRVDAAVLRNLAGSAYRSDVIEAELRKARQEAIEAAARE
ncbi:MAG TPA: hypothetical protein VFH85_07905 [Gammaproteobacteria bacterium]|nr:hypothetical protein [Gammaproteobacteria bacterium]